jgi:hypothetical protein
VSGRDELTKPIVDSKFLIQDKPKDGAVSAIFSAYSISIRVITAALALDPVQLGLDPFMIGGL